MIVEQTYLRNKLYFPHSRAYNNSAICQITQALQNIMRKVRESLRQRSKALQPSIFTFNKSVKIAALESENILYLHHDNSLSCNKISNHLTLAESQ